MIPNWETDWLSSKAEKCLEGDMHKFLRVVGSNMKPKQCEETSWQQVSGLEEWSCWGEGEEIMFHLSSLTAAILFHHQSSPQSFTESCQGPGPRRNHERSPPPLLLTPQQRDAAGQQNHHSPMDLSHSIASTSQHDPDAFILPQAAFGNL